MYLLQTEYWNMRTALECDKLQRKNKFESEQILEGKGMLHVLITVQKVGLW